MDYIYRFIIPLTVFWWAIPDLGLVDCYDGTVAWTGSCTFTDNDTCGYQLQDSWHIQAGEFIFHRPLIRNGTDDEWYVVYDGTSQWWQVTIMTSPVITPGSYCLTFYCIIPAVSADIIVSAVPMDNTKTTDIITIDYQGRMRNWELSPLGCFEMTYDFQIVFRSNISRDNVVVGIDKIQLIKVVDAATTEVSGYQNNETESSSGPTIQHADTSGTTIPSTDTTPYHSTDTTPYVTAYNMPTTNTTFPRQETTATPPDTAASGPFTTTPYISSTTPSPPENTSFETTPYYRTTSVTTGKISHPPGSSTLKTSATSTEPTPSVTTMQIQLGKAINLACTSTEWNITFDMAMLEMWYPNISTSDIYTGSKSCNGVTHGHYDGRYLILNIGLRDCLTSQQISDEAILYSNDIYYAIYDEDNPYIVRQHMWTYSVECDVNRNEATSSHVHHDIDSHNATAVVHSDMRMSFYTDANFQDQVSGTPLHVQVGDYVYVKVFTEIEDWSLKMRLDTCYTMPALDAADDFKYYLIKDGCEVDKNTHIISQSTHETTFVFQDFEYSVNNEGLDISCNATFCPSSDYTPHCAQSCNIQPGLIG